jgi:hypothetical protein
MTSAVNIGISPITPFNEEPYITVQEYRNSPSSLDYDNLVVGGNAAAQEAELNNVILRASSFLDEYLNQNLNASTQTETQRTRFQQNGFIALHPNQNPIISLDEFSYGAVPGQLTALTDLSSTWFEEQQVIIPTSNLTLTYSSQGPLSFGGMGSYAGGQIYCQYKYTSGYVNNKIVTAVAGDSELVCNPTGIVAGNSLRIYDGARSETVIVDSSYTYGDVTIPLVTPLLYDHAAGITLGNMPYAIKQATMLVTNAFIKVRGDSSLTMNITTQPSTNIGNDQRFGKDVALALEMVNLYRRIR